MFLANESFIHAVCVYDLLPTIHSNICWKRIAVVDSCCLMYIFSL